MDIIGSIWIHGAPGVQKMSMGITVKNMHYVAHTAELSGVWGDRKGLVRRIRRSSGTALKLKRGKGFLWIKAMC